MSIITNFLALLDTITQARALELLASAFLAITAGVLLFGLRWDRRRRALSRPDWQRMLADTTYFRNACWRIFRARGFEVQWARVFNDRIERQPREVVFALKHRGELVVALCGRWVIPITSEVITRYERALATTQARRGMIVTTSWFTDAAKAAAIGLPVELHDAHQLVEWMQAIWP